MVRVEGGGESNRTAVFGVGGVHCQSCYLISDWYSWKDGKEGKYSCYGVP